MHKLIGPRQKNYTRNLNGNPLYFFDFILQGNPLYFFTKEFPVKFWFILQGNPLYSFKWQSFVFF